MQSLATANAAGGITQRTLASLFKLGTLDWDPVQHGQALRTTLDKLRATNPHSAQIERAKTIARRVRTQLLRDTSLPRDLTGQCGHASMLMAAALKDSYALRTGFYLNFETVLGKRARLPYRHAWCRIGELIMDATATQFSRSNKAVLMVRHHEDTRYVETDSGPDALDDIMTNWRGAELPACMQLARELELSTYVQLARELQQCQ